MPMVYDPLYCNSDTNSYHDPIPQWPSLQCSFLSAVPRGLKLKLVQQGIPWVLHTLYMSAGYHAFRTTHPIIMPLNHPPLYITVRSLSLLSRNCLETLTTWSQAYLCQRSYQVLLRVKLLLEVWYRPETTLLTSFLSYPDLREFIS